MSIAADIQGAHASLVGEPLRSALQGLLERLEVEQAGREWPIDPGIRRVLLGLWKHGFWTTFSCEGHVYDGVQEAGWSAGPPRVGIEAPNPFTGEEGLHPLDLLGTSEERSDEEGRAVQLWKLGNLRLQASMVDLLGEFYADREVDYALLLHAGNQQAGWLFRLISVGGEAFRVRPRQEQERLLPLLQAELHVFGEFLHAREPTPPPSDI